MKAILGAIWRAQRRDQRSIASVATNIFFPVTLYFLQAAGAFLFLLAGLVLFFPLSSDPLRKIPAERLGLWPLSPRQHRVLRWITPWMNPITWLLAIGVIWGVGRSISFGLWGAVAGLFVTAFVIPSLPLATGWNPGRWMPQFPTALNHLIRKDLREMLVTLEFWMALAISISTGLYRIFGAPLPPEMPLMMSLLIVLAFASYATCLFGLDGEGGMTRYRLLPLRAWQWLAAKGTAYTLVVLILTLPMAPMVALSAAFMVQVVGLNPSILQRHPQTRWRFSAGASLGIGLLQLLMMTVAAAGTFYRGPLVLLAAFFAYIFSLWFAAKRLENS